MSDKPKGIQEGPPIWVESLLTKEEHLECHKRYPQCVTKKEPIVYDSSYHKGGKWRWRMGSSLTQDEIKTINKAFEELRKLVII